MRTAPLFDANLPVIELKYLKKAVHGKVFVLWRGSQGQSRNHHNPSYWGTFAAGADQTPSALALWRLTVQDRTFVKRKTKDEDDPTK